jgi:hypothetical protein
MNKWPGDLACVCHVMVSPGLLLRRRSALSDGAPRYIHTHGEHDSLSENSFTARRAHRLTFPSQSPVREQSRLCRQAVASPGGVSGTHGWDLGQGRSSESEKPHVLGRATCSPAARTVSCSTRARPRHATQSPSTAAHVAALPPGIAATGCSDFTPNKNSCSTLPPVYYSY